MNGDLSLLLQGGLVGVFMVFTIWMRRDEQAERKERNANWQAFMEVQNKTFCENLEKNTEALTRLLVNFDQHDQRTSEGFAVMLDRATRKVDTKPLK